MNYWIANTNTREVEPWTGATSFPMFHEKELAQRHLDEFPAAPKPKAAIVGPDADGFEIDKPGLAIRNGGGTLSEVEALEALVKFIHEERDRIKKDPRRWRAEKSRMEAMRESLHLCRSRQGELGVLTPSDGPWES